MLNTNNVGYNGVVVEEVVLGSLKKLGNSLNVGLKV